MIQLPRLVDWDPPIEQSPCRPWEDDFTSRSRERAPERMMLVNFSRLRLFAAGPKVGGLFGEEPFPASYTSETPWKVVQ